MLDESKAGRRLGDGVSRMSRSVTYETVTHGMRGEGNTLGVRGISWLSRFVVAETVARVVGLLRHGIERARGGSPHGIGAWGAAGCRCRAPSRQRAARGQASKVLRGCRPMHAKHANRTGAAALARLPGFSCPMSALKHHAGPRPIRVFCVHLFCIRVESFLLRRMPHWPRTSRGARHRPAAARIGTAGPGVRWLRWSGVGRAAPGLQGGPVAAAGTGSPGTATSADAAGACSGRCGSTGCSPMRNPSACCAASRV